MAYYTCLLLDADGTLLDFEAAERKAFFETMEHFELPTTDEMLNTYMKINKELWTALENGRIKREKLLSMRFAKLLEAVSEKGSGAEMNKFYLQKLGTHPDILPGTMEAMNELAEVATLAVVSNGVEKVQTSRLADSGLAEYMDGVFISEKVGTEKPNRRIFDNALRQLGIEDSSRVLVVGDSLNADIRGGKNAGLATCWCNFVNEENTDQADFTIHNWQQLYEIVMEPEELENLGQKNRKHQFEK